MTRVLRILGCLLAVIAAPLLLVQGMSNARMDARLADFNGFWKADLASALVQVEQSGSTLRLDVNDAGIELAQQAFASEPLASDALFPIAVAWAADGRADDASALVDAGLRLDKRNRSLGVLELQRVAAAQDLPGLFAQLNRLSVLYPPLINDFVQPLTAALDDAASVPAIRDALVAEPVWAEAFWKSVPRSPRGLASMYALRETVDAGVTGESDALLLEGLGNGGLFAQAFDHWDAHLAGADAPRTGFMADDEFAPIGWRSTRSGSVSFAARGGGGYDIYVERQTAGELARQLVRLSPGTYRFTAGTSPARDAAHLRVSLFCAGAEETAAGGQSQTLDQAATFTASPACDIYWLVLTGEAYATRGALDARLTGMQFEAVR